MTLPSVATTSVKGIWYRHIPAIDDDPDPFHRGADADGRWQAAGDCGGFYLADEPGTAVAEWYRHLGASGLTPAAGLPRYIMRYEVDVQVADLGTDANLSSVGLQPPEPDDGWTPFQHVGGKLFKQGRSGLLAPSAARPSAAILCLFRGPGVITPTGVAFVPPPNRWDEAPVVPRGLRT